MTLPTNTTINNSDDDSDMFGPPRSSPPIGYHYRSRVPMISPKLRQREERKRILQLCAHKLERIKDSEANLRRSVCINNTYSRLTDELRREKQNRYLSNLPKSENKPEQARDNIFSSYNSCNNNPNATTNFNDIIDTYPQSNQNYHNNQSTALSNTTNTFLTGKPTAVSIQQTNNLENYSSSPSSSSSSYSCYTLTTTNTTTISSCQYQDNKLKRNRSKSSNCVDTDLEQLDRELSAIDASMPLIDPEITQNVEHLEKALSTRKRLRNEDDLVREALSQYYLPTQRLISAIDECPLEIKRPKNIYTIAANNPATLTCTLNNQLNLINNTNCCSNNMHTNNGIIHNDLELDLGLDLNSSSQKEFEVIMDALRLGTPSPTPDSCGVQAAMMGENCNSNLFNNLCVTSLET